LALNLVENWIEAFFDAERVNIMELLFLLFGLMLKTIYIEMVEHGGLFDRLHVSLDEPVN
jgi:hypothetical protein